MANIQAKVDKIQERLDRCIKERDVAIQQLGEAENIIAGKDAVIAEKQRKINEAQDRYATLLKDYMKVKKERNHMVCTANPRMYAMPDVVNMRTFHIINLPYGKKIQLSVEKEGYRLKPAAIISQEDFHRYDIEEISKEELVAKYFSLQIEAAMLRRLRRMRGSTYNAEVKKIENTMFFRMPELLNLPCAMNVSGGSTCSENPNVRPKSKDELERELQDQGYDIKRGYGLN